MGSSTTRGFLFFAFFFTSLRTRNLSSRRRSNATDSTGNGPSNWPSTKRRSLLASRSWPGVQRCTHTLGKVMLWGVEAGQRRKNQACYLAWSLTSLNNLLPHSDLLIKKDTVENCRHYRNLQYPSIWFTSHFSLPKEGTVDDCYDHHELQYLLSNSLTISVVPCPF